MKRSEQSPTRGLDLEREKEWAEVLLASQDMRQVLFLLHEFFQSDADGPKLARSSKETPVRDIMASAVMYVRPDQTNEECMVLMTENRLRHLPVLDSGKLIGLISIGDLVKDVISEQKFIIEQSGLNAFAAV